MTFLKKERSEWLPTPAAAELLGVKRDTLKRSYMRTEKNPNGFLKEGIHWIRGRHHNSPLGWNVPLCIEAMKAEGCVFYADAPDDLDFGLIPGGKS